MTACDHSTVRGHSPYDGRADCVNCGREVFLFEKFGEVSGTEKGPDRLDAGPYGRLTSAPEPLRD